MFASARSLAEGMRASPKIDGMPLVSVARAWDWWTAQGWLPAAELAAVA
jgi:hypothetical protein